MVVARCAGLPYGALAMRLLRFATAALLLIEAGSSAAHAHVSVSAGAGPLRFHDERLRGVYSPMLSPRLRLQFHAVEGVHPTITICAAWASERPSHSGIVEGAHTRLHFVPVGVQFPYRWSLGREWVAGAGPLLAWAWFREDWEARVPRAGLRASGHGTGSWLGLGVGIDVHSPKFGFGSIRVGTEWAWAKARRETARGNPHLEEEMKGGWSLVYIEWSPPAR